MDWLNNRTMDSRLEIQLPGAKP